MAYGWRSTLWEALPVDLEVAHTPSIQKTWWLEAIKVAHLTARGTRNCSPDVCLSHLHRTILVWNLGIFVLSFSKMVYFILFPILTLLEYAYFIIRGLKFIFKGSRAQITNKAKHKFG